MAMASLCNRPSCLLAFIIFTNVHVWVSCDNINVQRDCGSFEAVSALSNSITQNILQINRKIRHNPSLLEENGGMASLHKSDVNFGLSTQICGAILISPDFLLTAAHCVKDSNSKFGIRLGAKYLKDNDYSAEDTYAIEKTYSHSGYGTSADEYDDLAILKTNRTVQYNGKIWPYCLPYSTQVYKHNLAVQIQGWGQVGQSFVKSPSIQSSFVYLLENSQCDSFLEKTVPTYYERTKRDSYPQGFTKQILCAHRKGVDACNGDSGGPLSYLESDDRRVVVGINSHGIFGCPDTPITPGFYTNIQHYLDWIHNITGIPQPRDMTNDGTIWSSLLSFTESIWRTIKLLSYFLYFTSG